MNAFLCDTLQYCTVIPTMLIRIIASATVTVQWGEDGVRRICEESERCPPYSLICIQVFWVSCYLLYLCETVPLSCLDLACASILKASSSRSRITSDRSCAYSPETKRVSQPCLTRPHRPRPSSSSFPNSSKIRLDTTPAAVIVSNVCNGIIFTAPRGASSHRRLGSHRSRHYLPSLFPFTQFTRCASA